MSKRLKIPEVVLPDVSPEDFLISDGEESAQPVSENLLRAIVDLRDRALQKNRIAFALRLKACERGDDQRTDEQVKLLTYWHNQFLGLELLADSQIDYLSRGEPIIEKMVAVKGIGRILAAKIVAMVDIEKADTVSSLWRYAGYGVNENGKADRKTKGEKLCYNQRLKVALYLVAGSFLKCNSPYRRVYDEARVYYETARPDWTKAHQHNAALRKMTKTFLAHLWLVWRTMEGLPTRPLYVIEKEGHTTYIPPGEFGWDFDVSQDDR